MPRDVVREEGVRWGEVVVGDEVTSFWHSEVLKVVTGPPETTVDQLGVGVREVLHPVDLA